MALSKIEQESLERGDLESSGGAGVSNDSGIISDLVHNFNRIKVWLKLGSDNPEVAIKLLDRDQVQEAADVLASTDVNLESKREEALKALGIYEKVENDVANKSLTQSLGFDVAGVSASDKSEFDNLNLLEFNSKTKTIDEWVETIKNSPNAKVDKALLKQVKERIQKIQDRYGVESLKGVELLDRSVLGEVENGVARAQARREYVIGVKKAPLTKDRTGVHISYGDEIKNESGLLQVRATGNIAEALKETVKRVRNNVENDSTFEKLDALTESELINRFEDVNILLVNMHNLDGYQLSHSDAKRLRRILTNVQGQYQKKIADKIAKEWSEKGNKDSEWVEVAGKSVEKAMNKRRRKLSEKIDLEGKDEVEKFANLNKASHVEAKKAIEKMNKAEYQVGKKAVGDRGNEPSDKDWNKEMIYAALDVELDKVLGKTTYNIFEDKDFWKDLLVNGDEGIENIVNRAVAAGVVEKDKFEQIIRIIKANKESIAGIDGGRSRREEGELSIMKDMQYYMDREDWGAAANVMLEYTTRVGMQENTNDLQYMYVRRQFLEKISGVSPDFAEQFGKNQAMNYLPGLSSQKPEDFYSVQGKIFAKSNTDMFFGNNAFMSGNMVTLEDGREFVFSTKTFLAALRSERNQIRIMRAAPNTMDSTLQNIMLEEMYGKGAHIHLGADPEGGTKRALYLALPGQAEGEYRLLKDISMGVKFANLDIGGFNGWKKEGYEMNLEEVLNKNQWMLRNSTQFMWYSEMWMDTFKSYQPALMANGPKALLTAASAVADYKAQFELIAPPYLDVMQQIGDVLGPMERYKAADMIGRNIADELTASEDRRRMSESERHAAREMDEKIGDLVKRAYVRQTKVLVNGKYETVNNRIRTREMVRHVFNDYNELDDEVAEIVRGRLIDLGIYEKDIPSANYLKECYKLWKADSQGGKIPDGKDGYMGQEYAAVWGELNGLKMTSADRSLWNGLKKKQIDVLIKMNNNVLGVDRFTAADWQAKLDVCAIDLRSQLLASGIDDKDILATNQIKTLYVAWKRVQLVPIDEMDKKQIEMWKKIIKEHGELLQKMDELINSDANVSKDNFWKNIEIEAFIDRTGTKHGDDWEQFAMKYAPAKIEAMKIAYKIASGSGNAEDYTLMLEKLDLFSTPEEKRIIMLILMERQHLMTSEQWIAPYDVPELRPHAKGSAEIKWVSYKDSNGNEFFARTADGTRAYHKKKFRGNYARQVLGKDMWRPHDFEVILEVLRGKMLVSKHEQHHLAEKILGTRRNVEFLANGFASRVGIDPKKMGKLVDVVSSGTSKLKLLALKLFLFDDPKYALWTFTEEALGMGGKTFEQIFGFSMGSGGGSKHH